MMSELISFTPGTLYKRSEILSRYGGQSRVGICTPSDHPVIFLFNTPRGEKYGYRDGWTEDGVFRWTGEGQVGNQKFMRGNRALLRHLDDGEDVHLFIQKRPSFFRYERQMVCIGYEWDRGPDKYGDERDIIAFSLMPLGALTHDELINEPESEMSLSELREIALSQASDQPQGREQQIRNSWYTSKAIRDYALKRAQGLCEGCGNDAPFVTSSNRPFLEVHHILRLSDGGPDHPNFVAALCPNCHRRGHYSIDKVQFNETLLSKINEKEGTYPKS